MKERPLILVVGSVNMDLVVRAPQIPAPGQTVLGNNFVTTPGGKGANQAIAAARLGGRCCFLGRLGDDSYGRALLANMRAEGIDCAAVMTTRDTPTGVAVIIVDDQGENSIVVASGANFHMTPDDVFSRQDLFEQAAVVVLQLELPLPTVLAAVELSRRHDCKVILDPAPAPPRMPAELFKVHIISPNASEAEALTGKKIVEERLAKVVASDLIARGASAAVLKLGPQGSMVVTAGGDIRSLPAFKVAIEDTTAAGDAFTGALAVAVAEGTHLAEAARFANAAGALACTKLGAQSAMPSRAEVIILMEDHAG